MFRSFLVSYLVYLVNEKRQLNIIAATTLKCKKYFDRSHSHATNGKMST